MIAIILIAIGFLTGALFALPTLLPEIRKRAQYRPRFRNITRIVFSVLTLIVVLDGLSWGMSQFYTRIAACGTQTRLTSSSTQARFDCDTTEDLPQLPVELWLRMLLPPSARDTCILGSEICDIITVYHVYTDDNPMNTWSAYFGLIAATLTGTIVNWGMVSFFTQQQKAQT